MATVYRPRIVIADDHRLLARVCKPLLEPEFDVVGIAYDGYELLESAIKLKPDAAIVDIAMPRLNGLDAGEHLKRLMPGIKLVFMTGATSARVVAEAFSIGASAYVVKSAGTEELFIALRKALKGQSFISSAITGSTLDLMTTQKLERPWSKRLTFRQRSIFQLLVEGRSMKEASSFLNISVSAISFHKYRIMKRLGAT